MPLQSPFAVGQNTILVSRNAILPEPPDAVPEPTPDVAATIAQRGVAKREEQYANEVRRLLDAGLAVMRECGTASSPRVADIVAAAGLSNDAFYRHFASKEELVAAILDDGSLRLASYLRHQMAKAATPEDQVRRWVEGVMAQATDADVAATTRAVLWNGGSLSERVGATRPAVSLALLLHEPFARLGSTDAAADAALAAHAAVGLLSDFLAQRVAPTRAQVDHVVAFCLAALHATPRRRKAAR
jgi:AcrR family transcriptional regulator